MIVLCLMFGFICGLVVGYVHGKYSNNGLFEKK
jgi:hypothetical protein